MVGGSRLRWRWRGWAWARLPSSGVTYFSSTIRSMTWLRRCRARSGCSTGLRRAGLWGRPASRAASSRVRSLIGLLKKNSLAASTP